MPHHPKIYQTFPDQQVFTKLVFLWIYLRKANNMNELILIIFI